MSDAVSPFRVEIGDAEVEDLRTRLARTRWPDPAPVEDWSQGIPLSYLKELCGYWRDEYDMQRVADRLNAWPQFRTEVDGVDIHFIHARSPHPEAIPMIISHGWPGSVVEFLDLIGPLVDPPAHGGDAADAFHVVCPSLPGFGFSGKPTETGWGVERIGDAWAELMRRLGYERYVAQGGDWGSYVTVCLADQAKDEVLGIHLNFAVADAEALGEPTADELKDAEAITHYLAEENGYAVQQSTKPQTLGYGLVDSPAAQCAWIVEKFMTWSECDGHPENAFSRDHLLDNVMVYWLTGSGASSGRLYWESFKTAFLELQEITTPTAYSLFPGEVLLLSERIVKSRFTDLRYYNRPERGGHFAALEVPELYLEEVRAGINALGVRPTQTSND